MKTARNGNGENRTMRQATNGARVTQARLNKVARRIVEKFNPERVVLFGSHAYGKPTIDSDVDLLVVMNTRQHAHKQQIEISRALSPHPFGMDIVVCTPQELARRIKLGDFFLQEITRRGQVLYERTHA